MESSSLPHQENRSEQALLNTDESRMLKELLEEIALTYEKAAPVSHVKAAHPPHESKESFPGNGSLDSIGQECPEFSDSQNIHTEEPDKADTAAGISPAAVSGPVLQEHEVHPVAAMKEPSGQASRTNAVSISEAKEFALESAPHASDGTSAEEIPSFPELPEMPDYQYFELETPAEHVDTPELAPIVQPDLHYNPASLRRESSSNWQEKPVPMSEVPVTSSEAGTALDSMSPPVPELLSGQFDDLLRAIPATLQMPDYQSFAIETQDVPDMQPERELSHAHSKITEIGEQPTLEGKLQYDEESEEQSDIFMGYQFEGGEFVHPVTGDKVSDVLVSALGLSGRAFNRVHALLQASRRHRGLINQAYLSSLMGLTKQDYFRIYGMGEKVYQEIVGIIQQHLSRSGAPDVATDEDQTLLPEFTSIDGKIIHLPSERVLPDAAVRELPFGVRAQNCLRAANITKLSGLLTVHLGSLRAIRNMGETSIAHIREVTERHFNHVIERMEQRGWGLEDEELEQTQEDQLEDVLAEGYRVQQDWIINRLSLTACEDRTLVVLGLSNRTINYLAANDYITIGPLVGLPLSTLEEITGLGSQSLEEIRIKLERYLALNCVNPLPESLEAERTTPFQNVNEPLDTMLLRMFWSNPLASRDMRAIQAILGDGTKVHEITEALQKLASNGTLLESEGYYYLRLPSYLDRLTDIEAQLSLEAEANRRQLRIIKSRAQGKTLEEIGMQEGITRERVRQIEQRAVRQLFAGMEAVSEDRYQPIFTKYSLDKDFFIQHLSTYPTWFYLSARYQPGSAPLREALDDSAIPKSLRRQVEGWIYKGQVQIGGEYLHLQRAVLEDYVLSKYCRDEKTMEEFAALYQKFLEQHHLQYHENLIMTDDNYQTRMNRLADSRLVLWKQNQRLRYYNIDAGDYGELFIALHLSQYQNIEISTLLLMRKHPDLMEQYDIRDEYELHNLLKKTDALSQNPSLVFGRMPMLSFGKFDRDQAVRGLLLEVSPIRVEDLVDIIEQEYGIRGDTIRANWLSSINLYYHDGIFDVRSRDMSLGEIELLKNQLTNDFYFIDEAKQVYRMLFPRKDDYLVNARSLKQLGFRANSTYVFKNHPTAEAYFTRLLTRDEIVNAKGIKQRFANVQAFNGALNSLRGQYEIVEYEPDEYRNIRWFEQQGISKAEFYAICNLVHKTVRDDDFFTTHFLRRNNEVPMLNALNLSDWFYTSLLRVDSRFNHLRVGGNLVFRKNQQRFSSQDFLVILIQRQGAISINQLIETLLDDYDVRLERYKILEIIEGSTVKYNRIDEMLASFEE